MNGVEVVRDANETQLVFASVLDIAGAQNLRSELDRALSGGTTLVLDGGRVERVDTAALQILAAFCRACQKTGKALSWKATSQPLNDVAALLGLNDVLGIKG